MVGLDSLVMRMDGDGEMCHALNDTIAGDEIDDLEEPGGGLLIQA